MSPDQNINQTPSISESELKLYRIKAEKFSRYFLMVVLIGITALFFTMIKIFFVPVMLAAVFVGLFNPFYKWMLKRLGHRKGVSSLICCLVLLLALLIPAYIIANLVSQEAIAFYHSAEQNVQEIIDQGDRGVLGRIKDHKFVKHFRLDQKNWESTFQEIARSTAGVLGTVINKASKGTFQFLTNIFLTFFAMFYFFRDGDRIIPKLKYLSPLSERYEEKLIAKFLSVSRATIKGTLFIGLIKGFLGGLTFWIFGVSSPILWGVVMVLLSIIPMVGPWFVMYPAAIVLIITGQVWQGILLFLIAGVIIGNIDNVLLPRLVGREAGMHDLLVFFSTLGGLSIFGVMGFIIGPVIAALFLAILDVYSIEFKQQLDIAQGLIPDPDSPCSPGELVTANSAMKNGPPTDEQK
ncbi:MAG: AI-2E family transporter [bacterium]|nr:AI-2E family transporter [bacterium]